MLVALSVSPVCLQPSPVVLTFFRLHSSRPLPRWGLGMPLAAVLPLLRMGRSTCATQGSSPCVAQARLPPHLGDGGESGLTRQANGQRWQSWLSPSLVASLWWVQQQENSPSAAAAAAAARPPHPHSTPVRGRGSPAVRWVTLPQQKDTWELSSRPSNRDVVVSENGRQLWEGLVCGSPLAKNREQLLQRLNLWRRLFLD
ncbi:UNVERIFIED_CONTAM: hypothetical protein K2H54_006369 [Gekko kuhli]